MDEEGEEEEEAAQVDYYEECLYFGFRVALPYFCYCGQKAQDKSDRR